MLTDVIVATATELASRMVNPDTDTRLSAISLANALNRLTDRALRVIVAEARASGLSWQQIGDIMGTTRQGAYQRFGSEQPTDRQGLSIRMFPDAARDVQALFEDLARGDWMSAHARLSKSTAAALPERRLAAVWDQAVTAMGQYNGIGTTKLRLLGDLTRVDSELHFDAETITARVSFTPDGKIVGFRILSSAIPELTR